MTDWERAVRQIVWDTLCTYWVERDPVVAKAKRRAWIKALSGFSVDEIDAACTSWVASKSEAPKVCDIVLRIKNARRQAVSSPPVRGKPLEVVAGPRERCDPAKAAEIGREYAERAKRSR